MATDPCPTCKTLGRRCAEHWADRLRESEGDMVWIIQEFRAAVTEALEQAADRAGHCFDGLDAAEDIRALIECAPEDTDGD